MDEEIVGYHGTKKELVESICTNNFFINEDENNKLFLGAGVYFFFLCDDAIDWNIKTFRKEFSFLPEWEDILKKYSVIESKIKVKKEDILDLDEKENLYKLEILAEKIKSKLITKEEYVRAKNKTTAIINMMYKRNMIKKKIILKTFVEKINTATFDSLKNYPRKMFCVKDKSIILENKEKIDIDKRIYDGIIYFYR